MRLDDLIADIQRYESQFGTCGLTVSQRNQILGECWWRLNRYARPFFSHNIVLTLAAGTTYEVSLKDSARWTVGAVAKKIIGIDRIFVDGTGVEVQNFDSNDFISRMGRQADRTPQVTPEFWAWHSRETLAFYPPLTGALVFDVHGWYLPVEIVSDSADSLDIPIDTEWLDGFRKMVFMYWAEAEARGDLKKLVDELRVHVDLWLDQMAAYYMRPKAGRQLDITPLGVTV